MLVDFSLFVIAFSKFYWTTYRIIINHHHYGYACTLGSYEALNIATLPPVLL